MPKQQQPGRGASRHRGLLLGLVAIAAMALAVIAVGAAGITQATKCKNRLLSCSATSDQAGCRQQYGGCAINAFPLVVTCIFLLMGTTVVGMLVHVWWTKQQRLQEQQQEQELQQALADAAAAAADADATADADSDAGDTPGADTTTTTTQQQQQPLYSKVWDIPGLILFLCFVAASIFYFAIRITKSLNTAEHTWYPILLLVVELFGYTAMLPYAWMLVCYSRVRPPTPAESSALLGLHGPGVTPIDFPPTTFHVMVPCYTEESENFEEDGSQDIPMIRGTLEAILSCYIPPGCRLTVTLCDDGQRKVDGLVGPARTDEGKAKQLAKFGELAKARAGLAAQLEAMFPGTAGRLFKRVCRPAKYPNSDKQTNGKSANVNWALRQAIYGSNRRPQPEDVIVIFDCDHRPKPHFFTRVLQFMTETQADLVLTPQFFSNTEPGADIFNNDNIQFWKYLLPGYDASDYIACTGTNFAIRAVALQQAGWFPDNTVTEDYALSLKLKSTRPRKQEPQVPSKLGLTPGAGATGPGLGGPSYSSSSGHLVGAASHTSSASHGSGHMYYQQQQQMGLGDVAGAQQLPSAPPLPTHMYTSNPQQQVPQYGAGVQQYPGRPRSYHQQQQGEVGDVRASWSSLASGTSSNGAHNPVRTISSSIQGVSHQHLKRGGPRSTSPAEQVADCYLHRRSHEEEGVREEEEEEEVVQYNAVVYDGQDVAGRPSPDQQRRPHHSQHSSWGGAAGPDAVAQVHPSEPAWGPAPPAAAAAGSRAPPQPAAAAAAAAPVRRRRRFVGRYLCEHLATGLAPVEPRPWFQQRSRWTKGHFEVLFSASACPLAFWRYTGNLGERLYAAILYMIGTWSYITNFVSTPVFFLVPFFYLVLGLAPIAFTWELGLAASIYLPLSQLMMGYVRDIKDAKSIWLAGISNTVLSFTYFKAFLNTALTAMGMKPKGGFKPTMGAAAAIAQALDPVVLLLYLVVNLASMAVGLYMLITQLLPIKGYPMLLEYAAAGTINLNLFMPLFWACHNTVAPLVFFAYIASFNRDTPEEPPGRHYQAFVTSLWVFDTTCLAGALGCLWWSIILPNQGAQRSLFDILADYASGLYASALAG